MRRHLISTLATLAVLGLFPSCDSPSEAREDDPQLEVVRPRSGEMLDNWLDMEGTATSRSGFVDSITYSINGPPEWKLATGHPRETMPFKASGGRTPAWRSGENTLHINAYGSSGRKTVRIITFRAP